MISAIAYVTGLVLGASLIIPIGAQNAFVLRQGLVRAHVALVVALCVLIDGVLTTIGGRPVRIARPQPLAPMQTAVVYEARTTK